MRRLPLLLIALLLLPSTGASRGSLPFSGVFVRDQPTQTLERGLLRADLATLRGIRTRSRLFVFVAPSEAAWRRDVAPGLQAALDEPGAFARFVASLPAGIERAGPAIAGAVVSLDMPRKRGSGVLAFHLPPLLSDSRAGAPLLNSPAANQGHFVSGLDVPQASDFVDSWMQALYLPSWPSALGRDGAPQVPLRPLPEDGKGAFALFGGEVATGDDGSELREQLWEYATAESVPVAPMGTFPRRLDSLRPMLGSVRVPVEALVAPEGAAVTLSQGPAHWAFADATVRHPDRRLSLVAPVTARMNGGESHSMVVAIVAWYTPLLLSFEEAHLHLGVPARALAEAVHGGELPFFRDGDDLLFYRGHLERWVAKEATAPGKAWSLAEAREQARAWGKRFKLRGLDRASGAALPQRMIPIPEAELAGLVDDRLRARPQVDREDLPAWLKHFEPTLKPGKRPPAWALSLDEVAAQLPAAFSLEAPWTPAVAASRPKAAPSSTPRSAGGPVTLSDSSPRQSAPSAAFAGDVGLEIVDLYATESYCRTGGTAGAVVQFDVVGVPEGSVAKLKLEWDLMVDGRSTRMDSWPIERGAGTHEVEFEVPCPKEPTAAELDFVLLDPGKNLMIERALALDVRHPGGRSWPALSMPAPKACKAARGEGASDADGFSLGGAVGLSGDQIQAAVRSFQRQTLRCSDGRAASGTLVLEITAGCDGQVLAVDVLQDDTGAAGFGDCVADVMGHAPFPAHDMPDGVGFQVPLRYE